MRKDVSDALDELEARVFPAEEAAAKVRAYIEEVEADAARYRWLKQASKVEYLVARGVFGLEDGHIDEAIAADPRYTLTDLGNAYRRAMTNKLNGEVKAGED